MGGTCQLWEGVWGNGDQRSRGLEYRLLGENHYGSPRGGLHGVGVLRGAGRANGFQTPM